MNDTKISEIGTTEIPYTKASLEPAEPHLAATTMQKVNLEGLPAELKKKILQSAPNISALQNLARSSPLYYKIYLDKRKVIIPPVLLRDIGEEGLPDALAVYKTSQVEFDKSEGGKDRVRSFLSKFRAERDSSSHSTCDSLDIHALESLLDLQSIVARVASEFCDDTLSVHPVMGKRTQSLKDPSSNEKRRIYRALYRFEMFRVLFTESYGEGTPTDSRHLFHEADQSFLFFTLFETWEVEELACVRDWIIKHYSEAIQENSSGLSRLHPKKTFTDDWWTQHNTGYLMSLGLPFLHRLLNTSSVTQRLSILNSNIFMNREFLTYAFMEESFDTVYHTDRLIAVQEG